ncbi:MAG: DUF4159 domain-containing protein [Pseudomonadota bacterium]
MGPISFTAPLLLAALAALPALWLLMRATPPPPARVRFPGVAIMDGLADRKRSAARTPWPLLVLRLLAAALVIIGLAGPVADAPDAGVLRGPLIVILDDTWPAAPRWRDRRRAAERALAEADAAGRPAYLLTTAPKTAAQAATAAIGPFSASDARERLAGLKPTPFRADLTQARARVEALADDLAAPGAADVRWYTDGLENPGARAFRQALSALGPVTVYGAGAVGVLAVRPADRADGAATFAVERPDAAGAWSGARVATARDGRRLTRVPAAMRAGEDRVEVDLGLPLALRNAVATVRIDGARSAGAVRLADARDRRPAVAVVTTAREGDDALLSGAHYIRKALSPHAAIRDASIDAVDRDNASVVILNDVGRMRTDDAVRLTDWVEAGGVLVRFAGPTLAKAVQDGADRGAPGEDPLLPAPLRGGGRAFGGALSWETPQAIAAFSPDGPFADLSPPPDVRVRRQVLAQPGGETSAATWASLKDGTPIVTGVRRGDGVVALFHAPATPQWSDLPLDGVFVDMLRRLTALSALGPRVAEDGSDAAFAPLRTLDGFGVLGAPPSDVASITAGQAQNAAPERPPGFYGAADAPIAVNTVGADETLAPSTFSDLRPYGEAPPTQFGPPLLVAALMLLAFDVLATLLYGRVRPRRRKARAPAAAPAFDKAAAIAFAVLCCAAPAEVRAQINAPIDEKAADAALMTRLAFVRSGDPQVDRLAEAGLAALSKTLYDRTSLEPAAPIGVDPATDDLSVYPFLYWPVTANAPAPAPEAIAALEDFMRFGGLVLFDTRDDERAPGGAVTPERTRLREILTQLDTPPLTPLPDGHVLTRSFYLIDDLFGRMRANPVWVQAAGDANDAVTPLIIGGRDWAGAWARDASGRPLVAPGRGGPRAREMSLRAGVNIVMVAFTGNYKSDQVHTPILLERLGRR